MTYNFPSHISGDTFYELPFKLERHTTDPEATNPVNLEGATILMQVKEKLSARLVKEFSTSNGLTITNGSLGRFKFNKQIVDIYPGNYTLEIIFTLSNGVKKTWITGEWPITEK